MSEKSKGYVTSLRMPPELYLRLEAIAERKQTTINRLLLYVLNDFVQKSGYPGETHLAGSMAGCQSFKKKAVNPNKAVHFSVWGRPSIWEPLKQIAQSRGYRLSPVIHSILEDYANKVESGAIKYAGDPVPRRPKAPPIKFPGTTDPVPDPAPAPTLAPPVPEPPRPMIHTPAELAAMWGVTPPPA